MRGIELERLTPLDAFDTLRRLKQQAETGQGADDGAAAT